MINALPGVTVNLVDGQNVVLGSAQPGATVDLSRLSGETVSGASLKDSTATTGELYGPASLTFPAAGNWTLVAHKDAAGQALLTWIENTVTPTPAGQGRLIVVHAAALPAVDLVVGGQRPVTNLANGQVAQLLLPAGEISGAQLALTGQAPTVDVPSVTLAAGTDLIVYAAGPDADGKVAFYTQTISVGEVAPSPTASPTATPTTTPSTTPSATPSTTASPSASAGPTLKLGSNKLVAYEINLIHGIPKAPVDVYLDGKLAYANFQPKSSLDLTSYAGDQLPQLEVRLAGTSTSVLGPVNVDLPDDEPAVSLLVSLNASGEAQLSLVVPDTTGLKLKDPTMGGLAVVHAAAAPAVDLVVGTTRPITKLTNNEIATLDLKVGTVSGAKVAPTGGAPIATVPTFQIVAGQLAVVYVIGSVKDGTLDFIIQWVDIARITKPSPSASPKPSSGALPKVGTSRFASTGGLWGWAMLVTLAAVVTFASARRARAGK